MFEWDWDVVKWELQEKCLGTTKVGLGKLGWTWQLLYSTVWYLTALAGHKSEGILVLES